MRCRNSEGSKLAIPADPGSSDSGSLRSKMENLSLETTKVQLTNLILEIKHDSETRRHSFDDTLNRFAEAKDQLTEANGQLTEAKGQLTEAKNQLTEAKDQLTEAKDQLAEVKGQLTSLLTEIRTDLDRRSSIPPANEVQIAIRAQELLATEESQHRQQLTLTCLALEEEKQGLLSQLRDQELLEARCAMLEAESSRLQSDHTALITSLATRRSSFLESTRPPSIPTSLTPNSQSNPLDSSPDSTFRTPPRQSSPADDPMSAEASALTVHPEPTSGPLSDQTHRSSHAWGPVIAQKMDQLQGPQPLEPLPRGAREAQAQGLPLSRPAGAPSAKKPPPNVKPPASGKK